MAETDFDLNLLPVILAIANERSVSRAIVKLGWSQPKASIALNKLRQAFGDLPFVRGSHGMEPIPGAAALVSPMRDLTSPSSVDKS